VEKQFKPDQDKEPVELDSDELEAEQAAELPDREALTLISPNGIGSFTPLDASFHPQGTGNLDTIQPVDPAVS